MPIFFIAKGHNSNSVQKGSNCGKGKSHYPDCDTNDSDLVMQLAKEENPVILETGSRKRV